LSIIPPEIFIRFPATPWKRAEIKIDIALINRRLCNRKLTDKRMGIEKQLIMIPTIREVSTMANNLFPLRFANITPAVVRKTRMESILRGPSMMKTRKITNFDGLMTSDTQRKRVIAVTAIKVRNPKFLNFFFAWRKK
jgi:hypothetical protein